MKKNLAIILACVIAVALVGCALLYQNNKASIADYSEAQGSSSSNSELTETTQPSSTLNQSETTTPAPDQQPEQDQQPPEASNPTNQSEADKDPDKDKDLTTESKDLTNGAEDLTNSKDPDLTNSEVNNPQDNSTGDAGGTPPSPADQGGGSEDLTKSEMDDIWESLGGGSAKQEDNLPPETWG